MIKINVKDWKNKSFSLVKVAKQGVSIGDNLLKKKAVLIPANTIFDANSKNIQENIFVFMNVEQGSYDLVIRHSSDALHTKRKLAWAIFEVSGLPTNEKIAKKLNLAFGESGMFGYIGGGRARNGIYHSGTAVNIYKNFDFIIVKVVTSATTSLDIRAVGLIKKSVHSNLSLSNNKSLTQFDCGINGVEISKLIDRLSSTFNKGVYIIYANISPNVVDGSSIWLSSITDIVANNSHVILLLNQNIQNNLIISNIQNLNNVTLLQPSEYSNFDVLTEKNALNVIRLIDCIHPKLFGVLVRGMSAAHELTSNRQFKYRAISYVTDFYKVNEGRIDIDFNSKKLLNQISLHTELLLVQTSEMKNQIFSLLKFKHKNYAYLPPSLPDSIFLNKKYTEKKLSESAEIKIGYAGKIMPNWGVEELLSWTIDFNRENSKVKIKVFIAANKISAPESLRKPFVSKIQKLIQEANAEHYTNLNREQCIKMLHEMDYIWAYRPGLFENHTLELSTKLLEAIAIQQKVICYPSKIHQNELGKEYPFYVENQADFKKLMTNPSVHVDLKRIANQLKENNSISAVSKRIGDLKPFNTQDQNGLCVCFAGHDFKFIDGYISYLKSQGFATLRDNWEWGTPTDLDLTKRNYDRADVIFCEWGLANAVWFSNNNMENKPIYIRVHAQEVRDRAKKFGSQINFSQVTKVIFVSESVRLKYIELFKIPLEKTVVIPNFVFDDEYILSQDATGQGKIVLGMVGIVPQLKRLDRAVDVLYQLVSQGIDAELRIKGYRPETLEFMKAPSRKTELEYYNKIYDFIGSGELSDRVVFEDWGNDVALWYKEVDFILSPSDSESFHYALADGVLSGCIPVVWNWDGSQTIYSPTWIVDSNEKAVDYIKKLSTQDNKKMREENRQFIQDRYGFSKIKEQLSKLIYELN